MRLRLDTRKHFFARKEAGTIQNPYANQVCSCLLPKPNRLPFFFSVCGKTIVNDAKPLIVGSKPNERLEYPWVAAIYKKGKDTFENICGGSILSLSVVVSGQQVILETIMVLILNWLYLNRIFFSCPLRYK